MGNKVTAINAMRESGVPTVPGSNGPLNNNQNSIKNEANRIGYTLIIKAASGGGGRGMIVVPDEESLIDLHKITKTEVFEKLRGRKGSLVTVTISRMGMMKPFDVDIIRDNIPIYSVGAATMIDDSTGYIFLRRFSATTEKEVVSALDKLRTEGMERLILDLRGNSGGYLEQAAAISNQFIFTSDTLVFTKGKVKESNQVFISDYKKGRDDFSLIVLINRGSASASEIVAGAVQDLDRGLVVGETSFGKGLVQRQLPLDSGGALRVTICLLYTSDAADE